MNKRGPTALFLALTQPKSKVREYYKVCQLKSTKTHLSVSKFYFISVKWNDCCVRMFARISSTVNFSSVNKAMAYVEKPE